MNHMFFIFVYLVGGSGILIGLIGKRSKIPWAMFCWRVAAVLFIASGLLGWVVYGYDNEWTQGHHDQLIYLRTIVSNIAAGMLITLLLVCRKFESAKMMPKT